MYMYEWRVVLKIFRGIFRGMHVSPAKHSYGSVTNGQTDGRTTDKVIPMCRYASQATEKRCPAVYINGCFIAITGQFL